MGKGIVTVKGVKIDVVKIREVSEKKCRRKVHLLTPIPERKAEKKEEKKEEKKKEVHTVIIYGIISEINLFSSIRVQYNIFIQIRTGDHNF